MSEDTGFLVSRPRIDGQDIEIADHMRFGPDGKIHEFTVFFRPLPAATAALCLIGAVSVGGRARPGRRSSPPWLARWHS